MTEAGYAASQYTILAQTYWTPIPRSSGFRYAETGWTRQSVGGCGVWNRDANWAHDTVVAAMNGSVRTGAAQAGVPVLDLQYALEGRRLCETGVGVLEEVAICSPRVRTVADRLSRLSDVGQRWNLDWHSRRVARKGAKGSSEKADPDRSHYRQPIGSHCGRRRKARF
jgi:hypothetical protein